jgi:hypothetical protein
VHIEDIFIKASDLANKKMYDADDGGFGGVESIGDAPE